MSDTHSEADRILAHAIKTNEFFAGCQTFFAGCQTFKDYSKGLEAEVHRLRDQLLSVGSHYGSALIAIGELRSFISVAKKKSLDRFGGCIYCGRNESMGHAENCELVEAVALATPPPASPGRERM